MSVRTDTPRYPTGPEPRPDGHSLPARPAPVDHPVLDVIAHRWSSRAFAPERPVHREVVLRLLEAARWAPSSGNAQPWRFLVFDDTVPEAREAARDTLKRGNSWARRAPVLLAVLSQTRWPDSDAVNPNAAYDTGAAVLSLSLQAQHEGLVVHQMAGYDRAAFRRRFDLPDGVEPRVLVAVGWPGDPGLLEEGKQQREHAPRRRRAVADFAAVGAWDGEPLVR